MLLTGKLSTHILLLFTIFYCIIESNFVPCTAYRKKFKKHKTMQETLFVFNQEKTAFLLFVIQLALPSAVTFQLFRMLCQSETI